MKKIQIVILALLLLFSMTSGCAQTDVNGGAGTESQQKTEEEGQMGQGDTGSTDGTYTVEELEATKPNELVREKLDAGLDVLVACSMIADVPVLMEVYASQIEATITAEGFNWTLTHAGGDTAAMISQIENYVLMGAACVILVPPDAMSIKDACLAAHEAGTDTVIFGVEGVDYGYCIRTDTYQQGALTSEIALEWAKQNYPDLSAEHPLHAAVAYNSNVADVIIQGEAMIETLEAEGLCVVTYSDSGSLGSADWGYSFGEAAMTYDNEIRIFCAVSCSDLIGVSNYILSQPSYNPSEFGAVGCNPDTAFLTAMEELSPIGQAILRGTAQYGVDIGIGIGKTALIALFDEQPAPCEIILNLYSITSSDFPCDLAYGEPVF